MVVLEVMGGLRPLLCGGLRPLLTSLALISLLTPAPLAAEVDFGTTAALPACPDDYIAITLEEFRWRDDRDASTKSSLFLLQVQATAACDNAYTTIAERPLRNVSLVFTSTEGHQINVPGDGTMTWPNMTLQFPMEVAWVDFNLSTYYVVSAVYDESRASDENQWVKDRKFQPKLLNGFAKLPMTVSPGVIEAQYLQPLNLIRLSKVGDFNLTDCDSVSTEEDVCYFLNSGPQGHDVCITQATDEEPTVILVCDDSVDFVTVSQTTSLTAVKLWYPGGSADGSTDGIVTISQTNPDTSLVLYQYIDKQYQACDNDTGVRPRRCTLDGFEPSNETYIFRIMEMSADGYPTSSREVFVQDFNVTTRGVSNDTVQVSWDPGFNDVFTVTISPEPTAPYSGAEVECSGPTTCDFFFIGLDAQEWTSYTIAVQIQNDDNLPTEVVTSLSSPPAPVTDVHRITSLSHYAATSITTLTEGCFELSDDISPSLELYNALLLIIDSSGRAAQASELVRNDSNTHCFSPVAFEGEFPKDRTRLLVNFNSQDGTTYTTQMDAYLLAPDIQQVSNQSARITWRNLNLAEFSTYRPPQYKDDVEEALTLECTYTGDKCYYYVNEDTPGSGNFSLYETSENLNQTATVHLPMNEISNELEIVTPFSARHDDRLRVCFDAINDVDHYELGIELLGELVSSDQNASLETVSGKTCAISSQPVTLGAYEELWGVVVGYGGDGGILAAGEQSYKDTFLSANRFVLVVSTVTGASTELWSSWFIVDDTSSFDNYRVELVNDKGESVVKDDKVDISDTTYTFDISNDGLYAVCVSIDNSVNGDTSVQTCSDIVTVKLSADPADPVPGVENVQHFFTKDSVKLSWDRPEDASALLVSWNAETPPETEHLFETSRNSDFSPPKREAREQFLRDSVVVEEQFSIYPDVQGPLHRAKALRNLQKEANEVKLQKISKDGFTLVPGSQSFVDIPITEGTFNFCVSAVKQHQSGEPVCQTSTLRPADTPVGAPTDLVYSEDEGLSWTPPSDDNPINRYTYYLEWSRGPETISATTETPNFMPADVVEAGEWQVAVYSTTHTSHLSDRLSATVVVRGIKVTYDQTGLRRLTLSWEDTSASGPSSPEDEEVSYIVSLQDGQEATTTCSRQAGCSVTFDDVEAEEEQLLNVTVQRTDDENMKEDIEIYFLDIATVSEDKMTRTVNANDSVTVTWTCVEGVSFYNVSLVDADDVVLFYDRQTMPCSYTFDDPSPSSRSLQDDSVLLQACLTSASSGRCGNSARLSLVPDPPPPDTGGPNVLVIVLSSVAAGLLLILMVAGIVFKMRRDRAQRAAAEAGESISSLRMDSGSQHSVDPPGGTATDPEQPQNDIIPQARSGITSTPHSSGQTPAERQTPNLYRSAAPIPRAVAQPANGNAFELNSAPRRYPEGPRAPMSTVNPNIRYDGPTQRSAPGNAGVQRMPQGGNAAPPQRFSAPRLAEPIRGPPANNVRGSGPPPRMSGPAGPSGFRAEPQRSGPPQGARLQQLPASQPIEVVGRFSRAPVAARPTSMSPTRAPVPQQAGPRMSTSPVRYPPRQRPMPGPSSPTRPQGPLPSGPRQAPMAGRGGYTGRSQSPPRLRSSPYAPRQFSPERTSRQPQPQFPRGQGRDYSAPARARPNNIGGRPY